MISFGIFPRNCRNIPLCSKPRREQEATDRDDSAGRIWNVSDWDCNKLAEREGFEPSIQVLARITV
jgi:hypothetical protein